jgi:8-oxo-dGTP diphosphatase
MSDYPEIKLTVDAVIFGYKSSEDLRVLLIKRKNDPFKDLWAIPGGFVEQDEPLEKAAIRELEEETGVRITSLEQLYAFGDPGRDPRGRTVSVAYFGILNAKKHTIAAADDAKEVAWFKVDELPKLAFDHKEILKMAIGKARDKIRSGTMG